MNPLLTSLALSALLASPAHALQPEMTLGEVCEISDYVILGEVTSGETRWASHAPDGAIERIRWVRPIDVLRGRIQGTVEVVLPGGTMGELTHWVEDVPELLTNTQYVLFLYETDNGLQIIGGEQGAQRVARSATEKGMTLEAIRKELEVCRAR